MSVQNKKIYRVRNLSGHDIAVLIEVKEDDGSSFGSHLTETRNGKIALGGIDSFWLVTGEKSTARFAERSKDSPVSVFSKPTPSVISRMKSSSDLDPYSELLSLGGQGKLDTVTFATTTRLKVGFTPTGMSHAELVDLLRNGKLVIQSKSPVDFIEVQAGVWMTDGFTMGQDGFYGFSDSAQVRSVKTAKFEGREDSLRVGSGLVVFRTAQRLSSDNVVDLRPEPEILQSAETWLLRAGRAAVGVEPTASLSDLFAQRIASTVDSSEKEDLVAALRILGTREELADTMLLMMARDAGWRHRLEAFERDEEERVRAEVKTRIAAEAQEESGRLLEIRGLISEAEARLENAAHRAVLLKSETEQHDAQLREKILEAARAIGGGAADTIQALREEVRLIRNELSKFEQGMVPAPATPQSAPIVVASESVEPLAARSAFEFTASEADRVSIVKELAAATGLTPADIAAIILHSTENLPVLVGRHAIMAATGIVSAIGGHNAAIVFCDPTKVTLSDVLGDALGGLGEAISLARARPDVLVPVALCNLTCGPCEFWLPQLLELRRLGKIPRNLALVASAAADGMRVSVPPSLIRAFVPMKTGDVSGNSSPVEHAGGWSFSETEDPMRTQEAVRFLLKGDRRIDGGLLGPFAQMLSRVQVSAEVTMDAVRDVLLKQQDWMESLRDGSENEFVGFFQRIEG